MSIDVHKLQVENEAARRQDADRANLLCEHILEGNKEILEVCYFEKSVSFLAHMSTLQRLPQHAGATDTE